MQDKIKPIKYSLTKKLLLSLCVISIIIGLIVTTISFFYVKQNTKELLSQLTLSCANNVANMLHDAPIDKFLKGEEQELYNRHLKSIKNIATTYRLEYLYVYVPDVVNNREIAVLSSDDKGNIIKNFNLGQSPDTLVLPEEVKELYINNEKPIVITDNNEYGHVISAYSVITDKNQKPTAVVGADINFGFIQSKIFKDVALTFAFIFTTLFVIYVIIIYFIRKIFILPIIQLSKEMENFIKTGEFNEKKLQKNSDDEFNVISGLYSLMAKDKKRMADDLMMAQTIQTSSLPSIFPAYPDHHEFDIYASMVAAKDVGGDFYDFFFVNADTFAFLIADVSGKGVPAALFMMQAKTLIKNIIKAGGSPSEAMEIVNHKLCKNNKKGLFITMFLVTIELKTGKAVFVNAGHNPPLIKRVNGEYKYLSIDSNLVVGALEKTKYEPKEEQFYPGDKMFLYTDGITEAMNTSLDLYGTERLLTALNNNKDASTEDIIALVKDDVKNFIENAEQSDDTTMLSFEYKGKQK